MFERNMIIFFTNHFKDQLKRLKKKYPHVKEDTLSVLEKFNPQKSHSGIGHSIYKERVPSTDMKKGKSGGFRAYLFFVWEEDTLIPFAIHTKSEQGQLHESEIQYHFEKMTLEIRRSKRP